MKTLRHELSEEDLKKFRKNIADFFAKILMDEADKIQEDQEKKSRRVSKRLDTYER